MSSILIVEDEPFVDSDLRTTLAALGHEVTATTTTSENAPAKVALHRPDLVFMRMQRKGLDDAARLHTEYGVPVIHLNPAVDGPDLVQPEVTRPYGYLLKPFAERELQSTIEVALDPHGMQRALAVRDRWFATTLRSIGDGVITTDRTEHVTYLNRVAEVLTGWSCAEAISRPLSEVFRIVHETTRALVPSPVTRALREGAVVGLADHTALIRRHVGEVSIADSAAPIIDDQGEIHGVVVVFRDATLERQAQQLQEESRRELHELVERMPEAVVVLQEGRIVYANPAWVACLGYASIDELVGRELVEFLHPDDQELERARQAAVVSGAVSPHEFRYFCRGGRVATLEVVPVLLRQYRGKPSVLKVARDVTEQRLFQARLAQADRLVAVGTMSAGVAHEINNPLSYVISNVEFAAAEIPRLVEALEAREADLSERYGARALAESAGAAPGNTIRRLREIAEALGDVREGAERVRNIVRDLKTFSRATDDTSELVHLRSLINSTLNLAFNEIRHRARLVKDFGETPLVLANPSRLGQVILNLLLNAAQAIPMGNAERNEIRIVTRTDAAGRAVMEVRDTGEGIPAANLRSIFDPFFTTKPVGMGTGLGLSICHGIVSAMGGSIEVESAVGQGSTFRVVLPAAPPEVPVPRSTSRPEIVSSRRGRILVIDDERAVGNVIRRLLAADHDVTVTVEARWALKEIVEGARFDVIICDLMMPEVTGIELYETLATEVPDQAGRMIFLTGGAFTPAAHAFLERVSNMRLEKPFDAKVLRAIVSDRLR